MCRTWFCPPEEDREDSHCLGLLVDIEPIDGAVDRRMSNPRQYVVTMPAGYRAKARASTITVAPGTGNGAGNHRERVGATLVVAL